MKHIYTRPLLQGNGLLSCKHSLCLKLLLARVSFSNTLQVWFSRRRVGCCNADGADHPPSITWRFTGSTHSAALPIARPRSQRPLPSNWIPGKPDMSLSSVPPAGYFPCCLSRCRAAPQVFGKRDIRTRGSHGGDATATLAQILSGSLFFIVASFCLAVLERRQGEGFVCASSSSRLPGNSQGPSANLGCFIHSWLVAALLPAHRPCPLMGGRVSPFPLPKAGLGGAAPRRGVHANGDTQGTPPRSPTVQGLWIQPHTSSVLPVPTASPSRGIRCTDKSRSVWVCPLPTLLPVCTKVLLWHFRPKDTFAFQD